MEITSFIKLNNEIREIADALARKEIDKAKIRITKAEETIQDILKNLKENIVTKQNVDTELSNTSENPLQNKALYVLFENIATKIAKIEQELLGLHEDDGDLSTLKTTAKDSLVSAINEILLSYHDFKIAVAEAINAKDADVVINNPAETPPQGFIDAIAQMKVGNLIISGAGNTDRGFWLFNIENLIISGECSDMTIINTELAQYQVIEVPNQEEEHMICAATIETMLLGRYSLMIRCRTSEKVNQNLFRIKVFHVEAGTNLNAIIVQDAYIKGTDFNAANEFEVFGLTFDNKSKLRNIRFEVYAVACSTPLNLDIDYIIINNTFTAIGSLT